jgi:hypothetical protein
MLMRNATAAAACLLRMLATGPLLLLKWSKSPLPPTFKNTVKVSAAGFAGTCSVPGPEISQRVPTGPNTAYRPANPPADRLDPA